MSMQEQRLLTYIVVHRGEAGGSGQRNVIVGSAEPFYGQSVEDMVESVRENAELRWSRQRGEDMSA